MKRKILHLFTDSKFISFVSFFEDDYFDNDIILLGKYPKDLHLNRKKLYALPLSMKSMKKVVQHAGDYDLIVVYDLDFAKSYIVNRLKSSIPVIWRFFGYELYTRTNRTMFSEKTEAYLSKYSDINTLVHYMMSYPVIYPMSKLEGKTEFENAIRRVNYFWCLSREEYDYLSDEFALPEFLQNPYLPSARSETVDIQKGKNKILIGHNRSPYVNHLDVLDIVGKYTAIEIFAFLSYGRKGRYYRELKKRIKELKNAHIIANFLNLEDFNSFYGSLDAFVLNSYRQMGVNNILAGFQYGVKIYLNTRNIYFDFFKKNGFKVFPVSQIDEDLDRGEIALSRDEMEININALQDLSNQFNPKDFLLRIKKIVNNK